MSALGHYIEEEGIATVAISLIRPQTENTKPPRALWVPFELGRSFGPPGSTVTLEFTITDSNSAATNVGGDAYISLESSPGVPVGVPVDVVSWGSMLNEAQNELILGKWWQLAAAGTAMAVLVTAFSLFTDALRDALDPKLKGRAGV